MLNWADWLEELSEIVGEYERIPVCFIMSKEEARAYYDACLSPQEAYEAEAEKAGRSLEK